MAPTLRIAIASGKGGTGKTTVATNLACVGSRNGRRVVYADCDVEEPNGHIFLDPQIEAAWPVKSTVPEVNPDTCTLCGRCAEVCQFSAIAPMGERVLVYPELCHGCGGCLLVCEPGAITETARTVGAVESGRSGRMGFVHGRLNVGEPRSVPVIRAVKSAVPDAELVLLDAPAGTSCPVVETIRGCDFVVLVTEATPFGLHDLKLAVSMTQALRLPFGVVVNRAGTGDREVERYCRQVPVEILAKIGDDRRIAEAYSRGRLACEQIQDVDSLFAGLLERLVDRASAAVRRQR